MWTRAAARILQVRIEDRRHTGPELDTGWMRRPWEGYSRRHTGPELDTGGMRGSKPAGFGSMSNQRAHSVGPAAASFIRALAREEIRKPMHGLAAANRVALLRTGRV